MHILQRSQTLVSKVSCVICCNGSIISEMWWDDNVCDEQNHSFIHYMGLGVSASNDLLIYLVL